MPFFYAISRIPSLFFSEPIFVYFLTNTLFDQVAFRSGFWIIIAIIKFLYTVWKPLDMGVLLSETVYCLRFYGIFFLDQAHNVCHFYAVSRDIKNPIVRRLDIFSETKFVLLFSRQNLYSISTSGYGSNNKIILHFFFRSSSQCYYPQ